MSRTGEDRDRPVHKSRPVPLGRPCGRPKEDMAKSSVRRLRRQCCRLHALANVERTISANDSVSRCRYLKDYAAAFQSYRSILKPGEMDVHLRQADIVLIGDYHALSAAEVMRLRFWNS